MLPRIIAHLDAGRGQHATDHADIGAAALSHRRDGGIDTRCRHRATQRVVIAAGEYAITGDIDTECVAQFDITRQAVELDLGADATGAHDMPEIGEQSVTDVDRTAGDATQGATDSEQGRRSVERIDPMPRARILLLLSIASGHRRVTKICESGRRFTETTANQDRITDAGTGTRQRLPGRNMTKRGDGDRQWSARGVATDQGHLMHCCQFGESARKIAHPIGIGFRQAQGDQGPCRRRTHRGEIRQVDRQ